MAYTSTLILLTLATVGSARLLRKSQIYRSQDLARDLANGDAVVALDKNMKTLMVVQIRREQKQQGIKDPCEAITCGALTCPAGFTAEQMPGHCCAYCVNPNIKVE